ncbi:hypothetical protein SAMN05444157_3480 [Frankineae bacterium MT45]|nr:hypothetical protein SAMN05444157_3480 [Frankineae bacterium MT45]
MKWLNLLGKVERQGGSRRGRRFICLLTAVTAAATLQLVSSSTASATPPTSGVASLSLINGWTNAPYATHEATATINRGIVTLQGAIATSGTNASPFVLPTGYRPTTDAYVPVDLCNATNGRLHITPAGAVTVQAETSFANAQCFTSLDGAAFATSASGFTPLTLINGWSNAPFATSNAAIENIAGVLHFKGAIATAGASAQPFTLPVGFRPFSNMYVPVDLCNANKGRLYITTAGVVTVQAEKSFSDAQCFTSLDGASFVPSGTGTTALTLTNGWVGAPFGTGIPRVAKVSGIVHLKGAMGSGTSAAAFTLPVGFRPATTVYAAADMCNATNGRVIIQPSGDVSVQAESSFSNAQCFTSLDGVTFATSGASFTPLTLLNGWTNAPFATSNAAVQVLSGVVHFKGAIATTGTNAQPFTLPVGFRPFSNMYVPVDLCNSTKGRLFITTAGAVTVQAETSFSNAQCFTSLDGASFVISGTGTTLLTLTNGWVGAPFGTGVPRAEILNGIVHLKGAMGSGTSAAAFTLPAAFRPATTVYAPVDMCNATNGRLIIQPSGAVSVQAETSFSNAQCFTSLDGATFAVSPSGFTPATLVNSWTNAPFATSNAAVENLSGIVYFKGAIAGGTTGTAFTLPAGSWPTTNVYVPVDTCNATNGRLLITTSGTVIVQTEGAFSNAQCFTSLDGASFAL